MRVIERPIESGGRVIEDSADAAQQVQETIMGVQREAIRSTLGDDWARGYDILTASQRVQYEMQFTSGRFLGGCLQGEQCSVESITAMPVAAAMRDAYKMYLPYGSPPDPMLLQYLSPVVPPHVLSAALFTVGATPDFTVPGMLNAGYELAGNRHAVTLGNLVIFSSQPDLSLCDDLNWVLHELFHVEQYMTYSSDIFESIDGFAVDYTYNFSEIEDDAQNTADERMGRLEGIYGFDCP